MATNMTNAKAVSKGIKEKRAPRAVAIPLPPLNPANIGNTWPRITEIPAKIFKLTKFSVTGAKDICVTKSTADTPFPISIIKTMMAGKVPSTR